MLYLSDHLQRASWAEWKVVLNAPYGLNRSSLLHSESLCLQAIFLKFTAISGHLPYFHSIPLILFVAPLISLPTFAFSGLLFLFAKRFLSSLLSSFLTPFLSRSLSLQLSLSLLLHLCLRSDLLPIRSPLLILFLLLCYCVVAIGISFILTSIRPRKFSTIISITSSPS